MECTKGEWHKVYDRENDSYHIFAKQEKSSDIWIIEMDSEADANIVVAAPRMYKALKGIMVAYNKLQGEQPAEVVNAIIAGWLATDKAEGG